MLLTENCGNVATVATDSNFRFASNNAYLTYSQCPIGKVRLIEFLQTLGGGIKKGLACDEHHQDGHLHSHLYVWFNERIQTRNVRYFDFQGYHPNLRLEKTKSINASLRYIMKTDPEYIEIGDMDVKSELAARETNRKILGKRLQEGADVDDVADANPQLMFGFKRLKEDVEAYRKDKQRKLDLKPRIVGFIPNFWNFKLPVSDTVKKRHYWFWSYKTELNQGKTHFCNNLKKIANCFEYSVHDSKQLHCPDAQFVLLDAYNCPYLKVADIEKMCDGLFCYPTKYIDGYYVRKATVIICANKSLRDTYTQEYEILEGRFNVIHLTGFKFKDPQEEEFASLIQTYSNPNPGVVGNTWVDGVLQAEEVKE